MQDSDRTPIPPRRVRFPQGVIDALCARRDRHNSRVPRALTVTLPTLEAVYRRGALSYQRPVTASGTIPSRHDWGMARVDAFLRLAAGGPTSPDYTDDFDLLPASHPMTACGGNLVPEEHDLAAALVEIAERYGKFNEDRTGIWAGYTPAQENELVSIGVMCANCVLYQGDDRCAIISLPVEPAGRCRFAVIPDGVVTPEPEAMDEVALADELMSQPLPHEEYDSDDSAIIDLTEYMGEGYQAEPAVRAAWMRALSDGSDDPFSRALSMAQLGHRGTDADLLPRNEKGASQ